MSIFFAIGTVLRISSTNGYKDLGYSMAVISFFYGLAVVKISKTGGMG